MVKVKGIAKFVRGGIPLVVLINDEETFNTLLKHNDFNT